MSFVSLAVDNETHKVNNRPRVGVKHGAPNEAAALRLLRSTVRAARAQVMDRLDERHPFSFHSQAHAQAVAKRPKLSDLPGW
jgi:hypothetical protein